jgi:uncharacterized protein (DUF1786 family)
MFDKGGRGQRNRRDRRRICSLFFSLGSLAVLAHNRARRGGSGVGVAPAACSIPVKKCRNTSGETLTAQKAKMGGDASVMALHQNLLQPGRRCYNHRAAREYGEKMEGGGG